jgi:hypothetical protein
MMGVDERGTAGVEETGTGVEEGMRRRGKLARRRGGAAQR